MFLYPLWLLSGSFTHGNSVGNPGKFGFDGLIRNAKGERALGYSSSCGYITNMNVELLKIFFDLKLA